MQEQLSQVFTELGLSGYADAWIFQVFIVVFLTMLGNFISNRVFRRLEAQLAKTRNIWDDILLHAARRPIALLIWVLGLSLAFELADPGADSILVTLVDPLRRGLVIVMIAWFLIRFIRQAEGALVSEDKVKNPMDETTVGALGKLLRLSIIITAVLVVLQTFGYSISGVLAFGGIGGIAVGFAAKDLLANFFGGLMIYLDRPFKVGDWVRSPDKEIEGTVENIGWRLTCIRTFDKRPLYVPNGTFASISLENPSRMTNRRIYEKIGLRYEDSSLIEGVINDVREMLINHPEIDESQTLIVNLNSFAPYSLEFFVYTFTKTTNWVHFHEVKQDVMGRIIRIVHEHGADFAFPTQTIHLENAESQFESAQ
ncbi:MAG: mechanosensitive ion channel [Oceanospirillales bacterium]|nr:mechanosensitive ion channel [Oceanospirillales bacterium]MBR9887388.1 mechanosensitive ion channel [Oceanospirillales bacterium]